MGRVRRLVLGMAVVGLALSTGGCALLGDTEFRSASESAGYPIIDRPGWTAEPTPADPAFVVVGKGQCLDYVDEDRVFQDVEPIVDQRARAGAAFLWTVGERQALCFVGASEGSPEFEASQAARPIDPPAGALAVTDYNLNSPSMVSGWVPDGTASVEVETRSGKVLSATVEDGSFLAWWPGPDAPEVVRAIAEDGSVIETIRP